MNLEILRQHLLNKKGAVEDFPFGPETLVCKVGGKMFALVALHESPPWLNLKCDPDKAEAQRIFYTAVRPGYHMNKRHWNTLVLDGTIPDEEVRAMVDESYALVLQNLSKAAREAAGLAAEKEST
ncbi:MmcQ/YjbR family DNA-binding protein [Desulfuromonas sp. AOP6]|uniref:MmcQ/YjbR family DNA-binding protein n=1 Tax=Desulfuromonas sp. AOP6 TaxID=1566351 RepID=UPI00127E0481|nr:MmcQ/YjbR family DNA-binding protein [Desulfuromonas sp. AOP6]BCA79271.1 DNA-binding protein [Desulfuromonas sp. AOP6]